MDKHLERGAGELPVLELRGLRTEFKIDGDWYPAVREVSLSVHANETLAIVGESGSGKSITALSVLGLLPSKGARIGAGEVLFKGQDLVGMSTRKLREIRGDAIAMIFQEPMTSLNPTMRVGEQIAEVIQAHREVSGRDAREQARQLLQQVGIPSPERRLDDYPHQFSGGMRQRVMIAMAIACHPAVLLADEPTTALDVTIQAQVLGVLDQLKRKHGMAMVFITHNLGVVALIADRVAVMYAGQIVELATVADLFARPSHPYTEALLRAMPRVDQRSENIRAIPGQVPTLRNMPRGCAFASRCPLHEARCDAAPIPLVPLHGDTRHMLRCVVRAPQEAA